MERRRLGRTEHHSTIVTFGSASIARVDQVTADWAIEMVLQHGVNHIDIAPTYGSAMEMMSPWMNDIRNKMFIGSKTRQRTREDSWRQVDEITRRLKIDSFDLFQLHSVTSLNILNQLTAKGGALETLVEMRDNGLTKWIGITGHGPDAPQIQKEALRRFDFDTVMFPVNAAMYRDLNYRMHAEELLAIAQSKDVGIQAIKMLARGGWGDRTPDCSTWYDPHRKQKDIDQAIWWLMSQPIHTAPSTGETKLLPLIFDAVSRRKNLNTTEQEQVVESQNPIVPEPNLAIGSLG